MAERTDVMISSTALDLPEHRKEVMDACQRQGMFAQVMEKLPASAADAIAVSLKMVDEAEIYVGIFAYRYGYVPAGYDISITEMEYNRAVARNIPRLIFLMHGDHPVRPADVETGAGAEKLRAFKDRVAKENIVNIFKSPTELGKLAVHSLSQHRRHTPTASHCVSDIPAPPEAFIADPYTLLQTHRLVGRQAELNLLTDWVAKSEAEIYQARILNIVAIGGVGKSALAWKWFNDIAPQEMKPLAGQMWWSFYESEVTFENFITRALEDFVIRALAYVSRRPLGEVQQTSAPERETQLLAALDREPFLIVLDGLERMLTDYARIDAAQFKDSQTGGQRHLRKAADPRAGRFLKKLAQVKNSRILVSTRLYPAELEVEGGDPIPGSSRYDLTGLTDEDAVELWRALNVPGARDSLLPVFATFGNHPLLIQVLAGVVKRHRPAPGNFEAWRKANPRFEPTKLPHLQDAMNHVLEYALRGLDDRARQTLQVIAAFHMPARYNTLVTLLVGKTCADERELEEVLAELEDRGLLGWDRAANRYDLHPIVRRVVWSHVSEGDRRDVFKSMRTYFEAVPVRDADDLNSLQDLEPAIELYHSFIGLGQYDDAAEIFYERLNRATFYRLHVPQVRAELLEKLFPDGPDAPPRLKDINHQATILNAYAMCFTPSHPGRAAELFRRHNKLQEEEHDDYNLSIGLSNLSIALRQSGRLYEAMAAACRALHYARRVQSQRLEAASLGWSGFVEALCGNTQMAERALDRVIRIFRWCERNTPDRYEEGMFASYESVAHSILTRLMLFKNEPATAHTHVELAWGLANKWKHPHVVVWAMRLRGVVALARGDFTAAENLLSPVLAQARAAGLTVEELQALAELAELHWKRGNAEDTRAFLERVWEPAREGPYPLLHAYALNLLSQVERDAGNVTAAVEAATKAYRLAWCDGPPFAYHWGLERARALLRELEATEPEMPAFDAAKFEPMPEVEIDPADEFGAEGWQEG